MSPLRLVFLGLALWGAIHPIVHYTTFMWQERAGFGRLIEAWFVNHSTTGLVWDLLIASIAATVWIVAECAQRRTWRNLWAVPAIYLIGLACGLPLYLYLRSRPAA